MAKPGSDPLKVRHYAKTQHEEGTTNPLRCISSLHKRFPNVSYHVGGLRAACSPNKVFEWTEHLEREFVDFKNIFHTQIRLSPFDKKNLSKYYVMWHHRRV